jgi:hypothetical protein
MQLSMTVLRCPDQVAPEARSVPGGDYHVGRGPDVDWVLPDPDRLLSKRHFAVAFRGGGWQVADTSTNGTFLNTDAESIGRGATRSLRDGDRLRLGAYEIEIRLVDQPAQGMSSGMPGGMSGGMSGGMNQMGGARGSAQSPFSDPLGDPFGDDPLAPPVAPRRPFDEPAFPDHGATGARLPHDFDPLAPDRDDSPYGAGFRGPAQSDHSSSMEDAMVPPPIAGYAAPQSGGIIPGDDLLPDDWDKDLLEGIASPAAPAHESPSARGAATPPEFAPSPSRTAEPFGGTPFAAPSSRRPDETDLLGSDPFPAAAPRPSCVSGHHVRRPRLRPSRPIRSANRIRGRQWRAQLLRLTPMRLRRSTSPRTSRLRSRNRGSRCRCGPRVRPLQPRPPRRTMAARWRRSSRAPN